MAPEGRRKIQLVREAFADRPAFDTAISRAILDRVTAGELAETMRVARPGAMVAFGRQDVNSPGCADAVAAAMAGGFEAVERLAGGRAAVFHEQTIALAHAVADPMPSRRTHDRFREISGLIAAALVRLGVDARVGAVPGEYCPGEYSVNARGASKLVGVGQRIIKGGAHIGAVLVVDESDRVRDVLVPVYGALELDWDPAVTGSVAGEVPGVSFEQVEQALLDELSRRYDLVETPLDARTLELAEELEPRHRAEPSTKVRA